MNVLGSLIKKESLQIIRDRRTSMITILMPLILLLLFGFAISTEVNDIRIAASVEMPDDNTRLAIERLTENPYFSFKGMIKPEKIDEALKRGEIDAAILMRTDNGNLQTQIIVDASNPNIGQSTAAYIEGTINGTTNRGAIIRNLYNPQLKSAYNFVPGIMGVIFILVCAIMTSVSIVGEKERGTMNLLLVSPARPPMIILGKLIPYFLLSCVILAIMLCIAYTLLGLPITTSAINVVWVTLLYIILSLAIGLLVSTIVQTQVSALIVSAIVFMIPVIFLSGMIFPIDNMPRFFQWVSCIIPARWYISCLRKLMVQDLDLSFVYQEIIILAGMTMVIMTAAIAKFNSKR